MANGETIISQFRTDPITGEKIKQRLEITTKVNPLSPIISLEEIPDKASEVRIQNSLGEYLIRVYNVGDIISDQYFYVNHEQQKVYVHSSLMGQEVTTTFDGIGGQKISSQNIFTKVDNLGNITENLAEVIDGGREAITAISTLGNAVDVINTLDTTIGVANTTITEGETTITNIETAISNGDISTVKSDIVSIDSSLSESVNMSIASKQQAEANTALNMSNSNVPLVIPTYDGSNQTTHPKVLYFANSWNGYKFWMSHTPYPNENNLYENPSISVSNDGITWQTPSGLTNPLADIIPGGYNSDSHILMNGDTMEIWWRTYLNNNSIIKRRTSVDGINWSTEEVLFTWGAVDVLSPAIIFEDNKYKMWCVAQITGVYQICYYESNDGKIWGTRRVIYWYHGSKNKFFQENRPWHIDVIKTQDKIEMIVNDGYNLYYNFSYDNITFSPPIRIISPNITTTNFDNAAIYRSTLVLVEKTYYLYYCGINVARNNYIGLSKGISPLALLGATNNGTNHLITGSIGDTAISTDGIASYRTGMVSKQKILFANSSGFPENMPGILITDNTYYTKGYGRQFYIVYNSTRIYIRYQLEADGTWSSWENMTNTIMNNGNVPLADLIATYPQNKVSYNLITSSYALSEGYPNNEAGTLITHSIKPKETGWQYQTYTTYTTNVVYYRFVNPNGTWSIWSKLLFNNPIPPSYSNIATSTISANSSYLTNITVTGTKVEDSAICNPANDLPDGLIMTCICRVDKIIIKISNVTSSPITFTGMPVNYRIFPRTWN